MYRFANSLWISLDLVGCSRTGAVVRPISSLDGLRVRICMDSSSSYYYRAIQSWLVVWLTAWFEVLMGLEIEKRLTKNED